jgi:hypothetical protein
MGTRRLAGEPHRRIRRMCLRHAGLQNVLDVPEENEGCCALADPGGFAKNPQEQHTKAYGHSMKDCLCTVKGVSSTYVGRYGNKKGSVPKRNADPTVVIHNERRPEVTTLRRSLCLSS